MTPLRANAVPSEVACLVDADGARFLANVPVGADVVACGRRRYRLEFAGTRTHYPTYYEVE